jgi:hypothetical protein
LVWEEPDLEAQKGQEGKGGSCSPEHACGEQPLRNMEVISRINSFLK